MMSSFAGKKVVRVHGSRGLGLVDEEFCAGFVSPLSARPVGEYAATILSDPADASGVAFGLKGGMGSTPLDTKDSA